jgi:hypothetical protein
MDKGLFAIPAFRIELSLSCGIVREITAPLRGSIAARVAPAARAELAQVHSKARIAISLILPPSLMKVYR